MNLRKSAFQGVLWSLAENLGVQLSSFVLFLVMARLIEPIAFGTVQIAVIVLGLLTIVVEQGFTMSIVQRRELSTTTLNTAFWLSLCFSTLVALALACSSHAISVVYESAVLRDILYAFSLCLPIAALSSAQTAVLLRNLAFRAQSLRRLLSVLGGGAVGIAMAFAGYGIWSLVGRQLVESILDCALAWRASSWRPGLEVSREDGRELLAYGSRVMGSNLLAFLNRRADDLIISLVLGPVALGYYAVAFRAVLLVTEIALRGAQRTAMPIFSKLQGDHERFRQAYYTSVELAALVGCPIFIGLSATAPELCAVFGPQWSPTIPSMQVLGLSGLGVPLSLFSGSVLLAVGQPKQFLRLNLMTAGLNAAASIIGVQWGILGVAVAYVVRGFVVIPLALRITHSAVGSEPSVIGKMIVGPTAASLFMATAVALVRHYTLALATVARLPILIATGGVAYCVAIFFLAPSASQRLLKAVRSGGRLAI